MLYWICNVGPLNVDTVTRFLPTCGSGGAMYTCITYAYSRGEPISINFDLLFYLGCFACACFCISSSWTDFISYILQSSRLVGWSSCLIFSGIRGDMRSWMHGSKRRFPRNSHHAYKTNITCQPGSTQNRTKMSCGSFLLIRCVLFDHDDGVRTTRSPAYFCGMTPTVHREYLK